MKENKNKYQNTPQGRRDLEEDKNLERKSNPGTEKMENEKRGIGNEAKSSVSSGTRSSSGERLDTGRSESERSGNQRG